MGRILLVARLAVRDLRGRRTEAALLLSAILAATTTLTLALVLRDAAAHPYQSTRQATRGPDVTATVARAAAVPELAKLATDPQVVAHSGPYPVAGAKLRAAGRTWDVELVGRDSAAAAVDQPKLTSGTWVSEGGVVLEASFAAALGTHVGDVVSLAGRSFTVVGVAVSAASAPYPATDCFVSPGCARGVSAAELAKLPAGVLDQPGLAWLTQAEIRRIVQDPASLSYQSYLKLVDPDRAQAFVDARVSGGPQGTTSPSGPPGPRLKPWSEILADATELAGDSQILLMIGAWLLGLLAVASLAVLVGGRMADQAKRVGLLKAVGGTPGLVAAVLLTEYLLVALAADAAGLAIGSLAAPLLTDAGSGLIGGPGAPPMTLTTIGWVTVAALGVPVLATLVPAVRAARSSTVSALTETPRVPRRVGWLIALSARLPVPLLLALRIASRRPRRVVLGLLSIAITVSGLYVGLVLNAYLATAPASGRYDEAQVQSLRHVLGIWMVFLLTLAAVNAIVITWATVLDNRRSSALARALGATPREVGAALAAAQVLPALAGAVLGFPGGLALFTAIVGITGGDADRAALPSAWQLTCVALGTVVTVAALAAVPAWVGSRRPVSAALQAEMA
jgi:ABC-type lipoprotein release transport system permease subunit